jgi:hypothetical protein
MALAIVLTGCGYSQDDLIEAQQNGYNLGYSAGREEGYDKGHKEGYQEGHSKGYEKGYKEGYNLAMFHKEYNNGKDSGSDTPKPVSMPSSGTVLSGQEYHNESEITVKASYGDSYVVSLKYTNGKEAITFFVRSGETITIGVPSAYLYVYFASGDTWYGYGEGLMFGENTVYSKDDDPLDFTQYTWEYTLYQVTNGNFVETPSNQDEFFG